MFSYRKDYYSFLLFIVFLFTGGFFWSSENPGDLLGQNFYVVKTDNDVLAVLGKAKEIEKLENYIAQLKEDKEAEMGYNLVLNEEVSFNEINKNYLEEKYKKNLYKQDNDIKDLDTVKEKLKNHLTFSTRGYVINIAGEHEIKLDDKGTAEEVLEDVKSTYTAKIVKSESLKIKDVSIKENVKILPKLVSPTKIKERDEAVGYILEGETISTIANKHGTSEEKIRKAYFGSNEGLNEEGDQEINRAGDETEVEENERMLNVRIIKEKIEEKAIPYETIYKEDSSLSVGQTEVVEPGKEGIKQVSYRIIKENYIEVDTEKLKEEIVEEPEDKVIARGIGTGSGQFIWPVESTKGRVSSTYGTRGGGFHRGVDFAAPHGTTIRAADSGKVQFSGRRSQYGKLIIIDHSNGFKTYYAHNSTNFVWEGETVKKGQAIGQVGRTGNATGTHLHFEIHKNGNHVNPFNYVRP